MQKPNQQEANYLYSEIVRQIASGQLPPGQRLVEKKLAQTYNTSRTPIREALLKLERDGLVQRVRNQGARVTAFTPDDIEQIYEIRAALECLAVRTAVKTLALNKLFDLEHQIEDWHDMSTPDRYQSLLNTDRQMHELIISHSGNPRLNSYLERLSLLIDSIRRLTRISEEHHEISVREHLEIIRALIFRDGELAERLLGQHIRSAKQRAIEFFQQNSSRRSRASDEQ